MRLDGSWKEWQFKFLQAILHTDTEPRQINWVKNFYWWIHWCFPPASPQHFNFHNDTISWIENLLKTWELRAARIIERLFCNLVTLLQETTLMALKITGSQVHWPNIVFSFLFAMFFVLSWNLKHFLLSVVFHILTYQLRLKRIRNCLIHPLTISSDLHGHKTPLVIFSHVITRVEYVTFVTLPTFQQFLPR